VILVRVGEQDAQDRIIAGSNRKSRDGGNVSSAEWGIKRLPKVNNYPVPCTLQLDAGSANLLRATVDTKSHNCLRTKATSNWESMTIAST
jgi:hypothetical protein